MLHAFKESLQPTVESNNSTESSWPQADRLFLNHKASDGLSFLW